jgi:hypothetical protein
LGNPRRAGYEASVLGRLCLLSLLTLSACGTSVTVAEKRHEEAQEPDDGGAGQSMPCGTTRCAARSVMISGSPMDVLPCCFDEAQSSCGIAAITTCFPPNDVGRIDPEECFGLPNSPIGPLPGCCRPDNTCGLFDTTLGFGCAQLPNLSALFGFGNAPPGFGTGFGSCKYNQ